MCASSTLQDVTNYFSKTVLPVTFQPGVSEFMLSPLTDQYLVLSNCNIFQNYDYLQLADFWLSWESFHKYTESGVFSFVNDLSMSFVYLDYNFLTDSQEFLIYSDGQTLGSVVNHFSFCVACNFI
jgi:hypothetical protein